MAATKSKFYTVWVGKNPGVYATWQECLEQISGYNGAKYKAFPTKQEATVALTVGPQEYIQYKAKGTDKTVRTSAKRNSNSANPIIPSISVDAACSGNPGIMEYQGVDTGTKELIFHQGPFKGGTNNIGEFLALVHALALLKKHNNPLPVYTDSLTARTWVKNKKVKTTIERNAKTEPLFDMIDRALVWLQNNDYTTKILVWDTVNWGEIPADFGRK